MPTIRLSNTPSAALIVCGDIELNPIGEGDPLTRLLGQLTIAGVGFHVEAIEVHTIDNLAPGYIPSGEQCARDESLQDNLDGLFAHAEPDGPFDTVEIDGRDYVIAITPHS